MLAFSGAGVVRYSDHIEGNGVAVLKNACHLALEGILSRDESFSIIWRRVRPLLLVGIICGVAVLLNCTSDASALMPLLAKAQATQPVRPQMDLRTYGVGAQILRELGVRRMRLLGSPRRMPSMTGYGLEITGFTAAAA